jgi:hypothetical protein
MAWYVSSPLTTGERSQEWRRRNTEQLDGEAGQTSESFNREVLALNREDAARFVEGIRAQGHAIVIDPTGLADIPGWTQSDYRILWGRVIERYVATVVFRNGWQHSNGCAWELLTAYIAGCTLLQEDLSPLNIEEAQTRLRAASSALGERPASAFLTAVLNALDENRRKREWHALS